MRRNSSFSVLVALAASLLASSCANDQSIHVRQAVPPVSGKPCEFSTSETEMVGGGSVDIGWTHHHIAGFLVVNELESDDVTAGGKTVNPASRNDFIVSDVVLGYAADKVSGLQERSVPHTATIPASGKASIGVDLLTYDTAQKLLAAKDTFPQQGLSLLVSVSFRGTFVHGAAYQTPVFVFPLTVGWSAIPASVQSCDPLTSELLPETGTDTPTCGNYGQDGVRAICVPKA